MKIVSLQELGNSLPIPAIDGKRQTFKFRPWRMAEEKKISELKNKHKNLGRFVREVFDFMLVEFGGAPWDSIDGNNRKLLLNQMSWANVFYMYCYLRVDAMGTEMKMDTIPCPSCQNEIKGFMADMNSLQVKVAGMGENGEDIECKREFDYLLKHQFHVGEVKVKALRFGFTPWDAMEKIPAGERNGGAVKESMLAASLIGALTEESDKPIGLQKDKVLMNLSKKDIEGYYDALDEQNGGPILGLDVECNGCGHKFAQPLNWGFDYFFGNSSL